MPNQAGVRASNHLNLSRPIEHFTPMGGERPPTLLVRPAAGSLGVMIDAFTGSGPIAGGSHGFKTRRFILELGRDEAITLRNAIDEAL